jgi:hypothetical protein
LHKLKRNTAAVLLVFTLFLFGGAEFLHNHSFDSEQDKNHKCEVCILISELRSVDIGTEQIIIQPCFSYQTLTLPDYSVPESESRETTHSRAPPQI